MPAAPGRTPPRRHRCRGVSGAGAVGTPCAATPRRPSARRRARHRPTRTADCRTRGPPRLGRMIGYTVRGKSQRYSRVADGASAALVAARVGGGAPARQREQDEDVEAECHEGSSLIVISCPSRPPRRRTSRVIEIAENVMIDHASPVMPAVDEERQRRVHEQRRHRRRSRPRSATDCRDLRRRSTPSTVTSISVSVLRQSSTIAPSTISPDEHAATPAPRRRPSTPDASCRGRPRAVEQLRGRLESRPLVGRCSSWRSHALLVGRR